MNYRAPREVEATALAKTQRFPGEASYTSEVLMRYRLETQRCCGQGGPHRRLFELRDAVVGVGDLGARAPSEPRVFYSWVPFQICRVEPPCLCTSRGKLGSFQKYRYRGG